jgi:hypothetical protein
MPVVVDEVAGVRALGPAQRGLIELVGKTLTAKESDSDSVPLNFEDPVPATAVLASGDSFTVTVTVTVPAGTRAGSYYAVVWAGPRVESAKDGITIAVHAGIREYLTVSS